MRAVSSAVDPRVRLALGNVGQPRQKDDVRTVVHIGLEYELGPVVPCRAELQVLLVPGDAILEGGVGQGPVEVGLPLALTRMQQEVHSASISSCWSIVIRSNHPIPKPSSIWTIAGAAGCTSMI